MDGSEKFDRVGFWRVPARRADTGETGAPPPDEAAGPPNPVDTEFERLHEQGPPEGSAPPDFSPAPLQPPAAVPNANRPCDGFTDLYLVSGVPHPDAASCETPVRPAEPGPPADDFADLYGARARKAPDSGEAPSLSGPVRGGPPESAPSLGSPPACAAEPGPAAGCFTELYRVRPVTQASSPVPEPSAPPASVSRTGEFTGLYGIHSAPGNVPSISSAVPVPPLPGSNPPDFTWAQQARSGPGAERRSSASIPPLPPAPRGSTLSWKVFAAVLVGAAALVATVLTLARLAG
jgi:hypothetical protein